MIENRIYNLKLKSNYAEIVFYDLFFLIIIVFLITYHQLSGGFYLIIPIYLVFSFLFISPYSHSFYVSDEFIKVLSPIRSQGKTEIIDFYNVRKIIISNKATTSISTRIEFYLKDDTILKFGYYKIKKEEIEQFLIFLESKDLEVKYIPRRS